MKSIVLLIAACMIAFLSFIGSGPSLQDDKYCAKMKEGKMEVVHDGTPVVRDVMLTDGSQVKPDGTLIKKDGSLIILKEGECVDKDGRVNEVPAK